MGKRSGLTPVRDIVNFALIIRCVWERDTVQAEALKELRRRGLWLNHEQMRAAGLS